MKIIEFILLFSSLLLTAYFLNVKLTIIARAIAFREYEDFGETKKCILLMVLSVLSWSIYLTVF